MLNRRRASGSSNYNILRRLDLMLEVFISLTTAPLNIILGIRSIILALTLLAMSYHFANYFLRDVQPGFTSILLLVSFFGSLSLIVMGFIGRYLAVIVAEVRQRFNPSCGVIAFAAPGSVEVAVVAAVFIHLARVGWWFGRDVRSLWEVLGLCVKTEGRSGVLACE